MVVRALVIFSVIAALCIGSADQPARVFAAPEAQGGDAQSLTIDIAVDSPAPLCEGNAYPIRVTVRATTQASGSAGTARTEALGGIALAASVGDAAVGSIAPATIHTGDLWSLGTEIPGEAMLLFQAVKSGETTLDVSAEIPANITQSKTQSLKASHLIKVVPCSYAVAVYSFGYIDNIAPIVYQVVGWTKGEIKLNPSVGIPSQGQATADVYWVTLLGAPICKLEAVYTPSKAELTTLHNDDGTIDVAVDYDAVKMGTSVACPLGERFSKGANRPTAFTVTIPSTGGSATIFESVLESFNMTGTEVITVTPQEAK